MYKYSCETLVILGLAAACASGGESEIATTPPQDGKAQTTTIDSLFVVHGAEYPIRLADGLTPAEMEERVERFAEVEIDFDESLLDESQRLVVRNLVRASDILDEIFRLQVWRENLDHEEHLARAEGPGLDAARVYYDIMAGPWDRIEHNEPFLAVGPKPPGAGYYPEGTTRQEIEAWLAAHPADSTAFTSYYTVIERRGDDLVAVPYSEAYQGRLERAATLLDEAAKHAGNASLTDFLEKRADAFRTNDYLASEIAWMKLEGNVVEPTIGPYEVYEDELMGWKAAFESFVTVKDPEASGQLEVLVQNLRDLEAALPIEDRYKNLDRSFASPLSVVDEVYTAGDTRAGVQTIAFNLPNDPRVTEAHGTKKVMLRNVIEAKFETILEPIAARVLEPELADGVSPRAFFTSVVMHELAHGLGPRTVHGSETPASVALGPAWSAVEEAKADVVGVLSLAELTDRGVYTEEFLRQVYASSVANLFRCVRFGTGEAHAKGCAVQFQGLLDAGAITNGGDGRFGIEFSRIRDAYRDLARTLLVIEATGDRAGAERLLADRGALPERVEAAIARLGDVPVDIRPKYTIAGKMVGW
jgi:hypothetical protein